MYNGKARKKVWLSGGSPCAAVSRKTGKKSILMHLLLLDFLFSDFTAVPSSASVSAPLHPRHFLFIHPHSYLIISLLLQAQFVSVMSWFIVAESPNQT